MFLDFFLKVSKFKSIIFQYYFPKFFQGITLDLLVMLSLEQERSQLVCVCVCVCVLFFLFVFFFGGGEGEGAVASFFPNPYLNFQTKKCPTASVSNIRDIAFCKCHVFYRVCYSLWTIYSSFHFF